VSTPSAPDERPRPQYGEYATPEEQRARIRQPDATWALDNGMGVDGGQVHPASTGAPIGAPGPRVVAPMTPARAADRAVTLALLALGALNVILTAVTYFDLAGLANQAFSMLGIPGEFTNVASAQLWGPIAAVVLIAGFMLTAFLAWRNLRAGRISWWIPVVGAIVTYIVVYVCIAIPLLGDPAFMEYATTLS
jgi:uncharacterized protein DUF6264